MGQDLAGLEDKVSALLAGNAAAVRDPYPIYREMRDIGPVYWHKEKLPIVTRHAEAKKVMLDDKRFLTHRGEDRFNIEALGETDRERVRDICRFESFQLSGMNGATHHRVRSAASRAFTPSRVAHLGDYARRVANDMLDQLVTGEVADLVQLTYRLPLIVLMELLGAPKEDADMLKAWGDDIASAKGFSAGAAPSDKIAAAHAAFLKVREYAANRVSSYKTGTDDEGLIARLLQAKSAGQIDDDEIVGTMVVILYAGHLTTTDLLGNGVQDLMRERDQWQRLCADPALINNAVEEALRFNPPVQMMGRMPVEDIDLAGQTIPRGVNTLVLFGSANRDPRTFSDPDRFDIDRKAIEHFAFGKGVHTCIGAALARLEARAVFETMSRRFPDMSLAVEPDALVWNAHPKFHGLRSLPVRLGQDRGRTV